MRYKRCAALGCDSAPEREAHSLTVSAHDGPRDFIDRAVREAGLKLGIHRGKENCPINAHTVQKITTMSEFIHSEGMAIDSKEQKLEFVLDGANRPCSELYRSLLQFKCEKNQWAVA